MPARMRGLPVDHRQFPVPWFVAWRDGEPIFPAMDPRKLKMAWEQNRCWVCGGELGRIKAFVIGPMCAVNRVSSEPPSHLECARFSAMNCPFLSKPNMGRVPHDHYGGDKDSPAGIMIDRNPGVTLVWQTLRAQVFNDGNGKALFDIGKPHHVDWFREGRAATRKEVWDSITTGLPFLVEACKQDEDPAAAVAHLERCLVAAMPLLPPA